MVHLEDTAAADRAVVRSVRLEGLARKAESHAIVVRDSSNR